MNSTEKEIQASVAQFMADNYGWVKTPLFTYFVTDLGNGTFRVTQGSGSTALGIFNNQTFTVTDRRVLGDPVTS